MIASGWSRNHQPENYMTILETTFLRYDGNVNLLIVLVYTDLFFKGLVYTLSFYLL